MVFHDAHQEDTIRLLQAEKKAKKHLSEKLKMLKKQTTVCDLAILHINHKKEMKEAKKKNALESRKFNARKMLNHLNSDINPFMHAIYHDVSAAVPRVTCIADLLEFQGFNEGALSEEKHQGISNTDKILTDALKFKELVNTAQKLQILNKKQEQWVYDPKFLDQVSCFKAKIKKLSELRRHLDRNLEIIENLTILKQ